ncbi:unnamed protein product [Darwinula stevensoni]|uniref:Uncharacterized protein n=1 Tax=Darwinula stevensoni TaxID=69355 RepID=A0A7R8XE81_9CRUS|nr:unnamed protein product [Darwinula stevensoni]CAG0893991.1 unnamed protein product [Darwinula stevensoni]
MPTMHVLRIAAGIAIILLFAIQCLGLTWTNCRSPLEEAEGLIMVFSTCGAGSGTNNDCGSSIATSIKCCYVTEGNLTSDSCRVHYGDAGQVLSCFDDGQFMKGACGSFSEGSCDGRSHSITCCTYYLDDSSSSIPNRRLIPGMLTPEGSSNGYNSTCGSRRVAVGRCASGSNANCSNGDYTALTCAYAAGCYDCPLS